MLLPDGRVLAAGGGHNGSAPNQFSAQVYSPPYLFKGQRPTITDGPDAVPYGSSPFIVSSPNSSDITSVALVALASVTHSTDMNQFYTELEFIKTVGQLSIAAPQNGNQVPPGYYMLFIVNATGVPSVAKILKIGSGSSPPTDTTPPTVTGVTPTNGATNVAVTTTVTATFSEAMGCSDHYHQHGRKSADRLRHAGGGRGHLHCQHAHGDLDAEQRAGAGCDVHGDG